MAVSASARNRLYNRLREQYGDEDAETLMDLLPPGGWDDVATKADLRALRADVQEGFAGMVTREELGDLLRLHVDARVGEISRWWLFSTMAMQAATIAGVIAAVRL